LRRLSKYKDLGRVSDKIFVGIQTSKDDVYILETEEELDDTYIGYSNELNQTVEIEKDITKPLLKGDEFDKWHTDGHNKIVIFPYEIGGSGLNQDKVKPISKEDLSTKYPKAKQYFEKNKEGLLDRADVDEEKWWTYPYPKNLNQFDSEKLMTSVLNKESCFSYDNGDEFVFVGGGNAGGYGVKLSDSSSISYEYLLSILNSRLLEWNLQKTSSQFRGGYFSYGKKYIENLPILKSDDYEDIFETLSKSLIYLSESDSSSEDLVEDLENLIDIAVYELYFDRFDETVVPIIEDRISKVATDDKSGLENLLEELMSDEDFVSGVRRIYEDEWVKILDEGKLREDRFKQL
jgi:hypothetical protein